jgi:hypothetical protein
MPSVFVPNVGASAVSIERSRRRASGPITPKNFQALYGYWLAGAGRAAVNSAYQAVKRHASKTASKAQLLWLMEDPIPRAYFIDLAAADLQTMVDVTQTKGVRQIVPNMMIARKIVAYRFFEVVRLEWKPNTGERRWRTR